MDVFSSCFLCLVYAAPDLLGFRAFVATATINSPWSQPSRTGRPSKVKQSHPYCCSYLGDWLPVTAIPVVDKVYCSPCVYIIRKSAEVRTENIGTGGIDLQGVHLSSIPTKNNHPEKFFLRGISPLKVFPPEDDA